MSDNNRRTIPLATYVAMLLATNIGWIIGTLLYHWVAGK
jgi:hypothetical protein